MTRAFGLLFSAAGLLLSLPAIAQTCDAISQTGSVCDCNVLNLRPAQFNLGFDEVDRKAKKLGDYKSADLESYKHKHPEPFVRGPQGHLYIIDHHHLARALAKLNQSQTYCVLKADLSSLDMETFWKEMDARGWVYLKDNGFEKKASELPTSITGLTDDPYRTLAKRVEKKGGFEKSCEPFAEFKWADFFRARIHPSVLQGDMKEARDEAMKWAAKPEACNLPGADEENCD
jgi:hypothetical protein